MNTASLPPQSPDSGASVKTWIGGLSGVLALAVLLYLPSLKGIAVWDDEQLLSSNAYWSTSSLLTAFTRPFGNYYRPLTAGSFAIENSIYHGNPFYYHLANVVMHAFTAMLVSLLAYSLTQKRLVGIVSGLFFATQPMQVGAAAWIGGRTDVMSTLFITAFLWSLVRYHQDPGRKWLLLSVTSFFLASLSKEQASVMVLAVPLSSWMFGSKQTKVLRQLWGPFGIVLAIYLGLWLIGGPKPISGSGTLSSTALLFLRTFAHYGLAFLTPNEPSLITFTLENYTQFFWIPVGAVLVGAVGILVRECWQKNRELCWLALCGLLLYAPVSNFPPVPSLIVGPYRCAQVGVTVACFFGVGAAYALSGKRLLLSVLFGLNLISGAAVTWWGGQVWQRPAPFFREVAKNDFHFLVGVQFHAHYLDQAGQTEEAVRVAQASLGWFFGTQDWAALLVSRGKAAITSGVRSRMRANLGRPNPGTIGNFMGDQARYLFKLRRVGEAAQAAKAALVMSPNDPWLHSIYALFVVKTDRGEAIRHWELALQLSPNDADSAFGLGRQRVVDHRYREADTLLNIGLKSRPDLAYGWLSLVDAKLGERDLLGAKAALDKAVHAAVPAKSADVASRALAIKKLESSSTATK